MGKLSESKILLIEDSQEFQLIVRASLRDNFQLDIAKDFEEARSFIRNNSYDLCIADIILPDGSGFDFCHEFKSNAKTSRIPIIFLTNLSKITDKIIGFSLGAEDYITKPFEAAELYIRVESKLKKSRELQSEDQILSYGPFWINTSSYHVKLIENNGERKVDLTPNEYKILIKMIRNKEKIISRDQVIDSVWGPGTYIEDRTIDKHISSLRKKLGSASSHIRTVPQMGYVLTTNFEEFAN